jgi:ribosomal protein S12 methylthiotransferase accessory factor
VEKVVLTGTHRVRTPEETLEIIRPRLGSYGITRLADVTGLDSLGVPVVMAVRPLAATLSVAQGKGITLALAMASAAMECIEFWYAEQAVPPSIVSAPAAGLQLCYRLQDLNQDEGSLLTAHSVLDWIEARSAIDSRPTLVPRSAVSLGGGGDRWKPWGLTSSTNGLASGNSRAEAFIHAIYELIERDACTRLQLQPVGERSYVDPDTVPGYCGELIAQIRAAGGWLELVVAPNRFDVACFAAYLWREDFATTAIGTGAHCDPAVALSRAVTEAAQSRLTAITGTRDDLAARIYREAATAVLPPGSPPGATDWTTVAGRFTRTFTTDDDEAAWLARHVAAVADTTPLVVDLHAGDFCVVKVLCPGLENAVTHGLARPEPAAP